MNMTAKKFADDEWDIATFAAENYSPSNTKRYQDFLSEIRARHVLFYLSLILLVISPFSWWLSGTWGMALIILSISGLCFFVSALMVPTKIYYVNSNVRSDRV